MSVIEKTDAIVLRSIKYRETSKIVTFYTKKYGKVAGIVKGAMRSKNLYGSSLEPMSYVSVVYYSKEGRELQTITVCDILKGFPKLHQELKKMEVGLGVIELLDKVSPGREDNAQVFQHTLNVLSSVNSAIKNEKNLFYYFEYRLIGLLGFALQFERCVGCAKALTRLAGDKRYQYSIERGGPICSECHSESGKRYELASGVLKIFREIFSSNDIDSILAADLPEMDDKAVNNFLWSYFRYHLPDLKPLKTLAVFEKIG